MTTQSPSEPFYAGDIIYSRDIDARIQHLHDLSLSDGSLPEDEADELQALMAVRDSAWGEWGQTAWDNSISFVASGYWDEYAASYAADVYGRDATETPYWNDERWASDLQDTYRYVVYDGEKYYSDGTR